MNTYRLLSTKILAPPERERILATGCALTQYNFIQTKASAFQVPSSVSVAIFTSASGVEHTLTHYNKQQKKFDFPCVCVGEKAKQKLEAIGVEVLLCEKDAEALVNALKKEFHTSRFTYFCGVKRLRTIEESLKKNSIDHQLIISYDTVENSKKMGSFDGVFFYSPSGVQSYFKKNDPLEADCYAIGNTTAHSLREFTKNKVWVASHPTVAHLIALLRNKIHPTYD